uniref:Phosphatidylinositol glycan anchor biosynthesis class F n=1 Tax=Nothoprocta perdicaria TaxID=30464 RepID=A0A8C7A078_NOTPE
MSEAGVRRLCAANLLRGCSVLLAATAPRFFLDGFSVLGTPLTWLCACSVSVSALSVVLNAALGPSPPPRRGSLAHKVGFLKCCMYFLMSFGRAFLSLNTFLFAVLLSTFTTLQCLCVLGPNIQAWIRVFSKNGAMSIWDNNLQITTVCSVLGAWFGAFPIPLDWDRPWQVWPISCSLGATFGYLAGLIIAPLWIHWNRKQLTYKSR